MRKLVIILLIFLMGITIWANTGRNYEVPSELNVQDIKVQTITFDSLGNSNIVAIQPQMNTLDYASEDHFFQKMDSYFALAQAQGFFQENSTVLLPEYIGTWLVVNNEKVSVLNAQTLTSAMVQMVLSQPIELLKFYNRHQNEQDKIAAGIFRMKAKSMAKIYGNVFKRLAQKYEVQVVAGSIVLPEPKIVDDEIQFQIDQPLYNVSLFFEKDGKINTEVIKKVFPIDSELPFVASGSTEALPTFSAATGKIGVLVCADSWYPETYQELKNKNVEVVLVPSFCAGNGAMDILWKGYNGGEMPKDVDEGDIGKLTEQQAWEKYALPGRLAQSGARLGVNVFLSGQLWDLGSDGGPFFVYGNHVLAEKVTHGIWSVNY